MQPILARPRLTEAPSARTETSGADPPRRALVSERLVDGALAITCLAQALAPAPGPFAHAVFALLAIGAFFWSGRDLAYRAVAGLGVTLLLGLLAARQGRISEADLLAYAGLSVLLALASLMAARRTASVRHLAAVAEQMDSDVRNLQSLHALSQQLLGSHDVQTTLSIVLERALALTHLDIGIVQLVDVERRTFDVGAARGFRNPSQAALREAQANPADRGRALRRIVTTGQSEVLEGVSTTGRCRVFDGEGVETVVVAPVRGDGHVIGAVMLGSRTQRQFEPAELRFLETFGSQMGLAIQKARLHEATLEAYASLRATEEHRARLSAIVETTPDLVVIADAAGRWSYANRAGRDMLGIEADADISTLTVLSHRPDWAQDILREQALPGATRTGTWVGETAYVNRDGAETPVLEVVITHQSDDGSLDHVALLGRDISDRSRAVTALKESEANFRRLFQDNPQPMMVYDRLSLRIIEVNEPAVARYGYTREEFLQLTVFDLIPAAALDRFRERLDGSLPVKRARPGRQHRLKDGRVIDVNLAIHNVPFAGHDAVLMAVHDVTERRRAEQKLRASEAELRALFAAMTDLVFVLDRDGRHLRVGPTSPTVPDLIPTSLLGMTVHEVLPASEADVIVGYIREALDTGETVHAEYQITRPQNNIWFECTVSPLAENAVFWIARDVTLRKEIERALRSSEASFRLLFEDNPLPMWVYDPATLQCLKVNDAALHHYGYGRSEFLEMRVTELEAEHSPGPAWRSRPGRSPASALSAPSHETRHRLKSGGVVHVEISSHPLTLADREAVLVVAQDVTERREAAAGLARLAAIVESSTDAIVSVDLNRNIVSWNGGAEQLYGYAAEEAIGKPITIVAVPDRHGLLRTARERLERGERIEQFECAVRHKSGALVEVSLTISAIRDAAGTLIGTSAIARDIAEAKQAQVDLQESNARLEEALRELRSAQQQVIQQERLRALGQMASGIAHDFNNALSPVLGFSELLLGRPDQLDDIDVVRQYLMLMNTAAKDAAAVVSRLREFYRFRELEDGAVPVDVSQVVHEAISLTQPRWKDQANAAGTPISLETDVHHGLSVLGRPNELRELLTNLIFNAIDAMPQGGTISISTRHRDNQVFLQVRDDGVGMSEEVRQRCLEPFFSTKGERGTGLGLSMAQGIVTRHGGVVSVESALGVGTSVNVTIPGVLESSEIDRAAGDQQGLDRPLRVLVVDDEPMVRQVVAEYLVLDGHEVEQATNGVDALEKFRAGAFDMVVTDRAMPGMNGDQLALAIKRIGPDTPVMLLTGFGDMMHAGKEHPIGVDVVVSKPPTLDSVRQGLLDAFKHLQAA